MYLFFFVDDSIIVVTVHVHEKMLVVTRGGPVQQFWQLSELLCTTDLYKSQAPVLIINLNLIFCSELSSGFFLNSTVQNFFFASDLLFVYYLVLSSC